MLVSDDAEARANRGSGGLAALHGTVNPDHGNGRARRSPGSDAPRYPGPPGAAPRPRKSPEIPGSVPERSRSASTLVTGWRWGQSRANPSRTSVNEHKAKIGWTLRMSTIARFTRLLGMIASGFVDTF